MTTILLIIFTITTALMLGSQLYLTFKGKPYREMLLDNTVFYSMLTGGIAVLLLVILHKSGVL